jgi:bifunctional non-homologous end joining protein LigD
VGDRYWVFDLLESPQGDLRHSAYSERLAQLEHVLGPVSGAAVEVAPTVFGASAKTAFAEGLRGANKEGVVFKDLGAAWTEGKLASGGPSLKLKFWTSCSCVVLRVNAGRRSVELGLSGRGVGSVTIPPNHEVPVPGQVVEVRYLYVAAVGGSLYQPVYLGLRDDIDAGECTEQAQQLKYKAAA